MRWLRNTQSHLAVPARIEYIVSIFIRDVDDFTRLSLKFKLELRSFGQSHIPLPGYAIWCWTSEQRVIFNTEKTISIIVAKDKIKSNATI